MRLPIPIPIKHIPLHEVLFCFFVIYASAYVLGSVLELIVEAPGQVLKLLVACACFAMGGFIIGCHSKPYVYFTALYAVLLSLALMVFVGNHPVTKLILVHCLYAAVTLLGVKLGAGTPRIKVGRL